MNKPKHLQANRIPSIDCIKVIAMLGVICLHSTHNFLDTHLGNFMYKSSVISVPLFFMVSGYLTLLKKNIDFQYVLRKWGG